jgi:hypothetical protein
MPCLLRCEKGNNAAVFGGDDVEWGMTLAFN